MNRINLPETKEAAQKWVEDGNPCTFTYGLAYRGAGQRPITNEKARELLKQHSFGMGFYTMFWRQYEGKTVLNFTEYGENDLY